MNCYRIAEKMVPAELEEFGSGESQYVVTLNFAEWRDNFERFDMGIEMELAPEKIESTRVEVNFDSMTGQFRIPDRANLAAPPFCFLFSLDEKGIVFIDDSGRAEEMVRSLYAGRRFKNPCLERFLYDFLELIVRPDPALLESYDRTLDGIEKKILEGNTDVLREISAVRNELRDLKIHYSQLLDLSQEFEENENHFFKPENERYFRLVGQRVQMLLDMLTNLDGYTVQLRDFCQAKIDQAQNRIMTLLTVISSIFMPLTLLTGWYGMNFKYMPELAAKWGYPAVIGVALLIAAGCLIFFKKKKWM